MMKLPAQKLLSLARDKIFSCVRLLRVKENWIGEFKSIQSYEEFIFTTQWYGMVFWIQNTKLIFYLLPKINHDSREFSIQREFEFNRKGERRKAEETTRVPNRDELFTPPIGFIAPNRLSYFKDDAILHEEKSRGISRPAGISVTVTRTETIE